MGVNISIVGERDDDNYRHPRWDSARLAGDRDLADALRGFEGAVERVVEPADEFGPATEGEEWRPLDVEQLARHLRDSGQTGRRAEELLSCLRDGRWFVRVTY
jgi:hypothetical protein